MSKGVARLLREAARAFAVGNAGLAKELAGACVGPAAGKADFCPVEVDELKAEAGFGMGAGGCLKVGREASRSSLSESCVVGGFGGRLSVDVVDRFASEDVLLPALGRDFDAISWSLSSSSPSSSSF